MKKISLLTCLLALGLFVFSCGDDEDTDIAPVVTITAPTDGSTASAGDTIGFAFTVVDDVALQSITLSGTLGVQQTISTFDTENSHAINGSIAINPATPTGDQTIIVTAEDSAGNTGEATTTVTIQ